MSISASINNKLRFYRFHILCTSCLCSVVVHNAEDISRSQHSHSEANLFNSDVEDVNTSKFKKKGIVMKEKTNITNLHSLSSTIPSADHTPLPLSSKSSTELLNSAKSEISSNQSVQMSPPHGFKGKHSGSLNPSPESPEVYSSPDASIFSSRPPTPLPDTSISSPQAPVSPTNSSYKVPTSPPYAFIISSPEVPVSPTNAFTSSRAPTCPSISCFQVPISLPLTGDDLQSNLKRKRNSTKTHAENGSENHSATKEEGKEPLPKRVRRATFSISPKVTSKNEEVNNSDENISDNVEVSDAQALSGIMDVHSEIVALLDKRVEKIRKLHKAYIVGYFTYMYCTYTKTFCPEITS